MAALAALALSPAAWSAYSGLVKTDNGSLDVQKAPSEEAPQSRVIASRQIPKSKSNAASSFTMDDIKFWAGDGLSQAALVIQWNDSRETNALVFGYRFNGTITGYDLLKGVVEEYPYLYAMVSESDLGYIIGGAGYDFAKTGSFQITNGKTTETMDPDHIFIASGYDFDGFSAVNSANYWKSGWMDNYWSYWIGTPDNFTYSEYGMSNHSVENGSWYAWNFISFTENSSGMNDEVEWKAFAAAEDYQANPTAEVTYDGLRYVVTNHNLNTVALDAPLSGTYRQTSIVVPESFSVDGQTYRVTRVNQRAFAGSPVTSVTLPKSVYYIGDAAFEGCNGLTSVTLPPMLYGMGEGIFKNCTNLTTATYPEGINYVPAHHYEGSGINEVSFPEHIASVGESAFANCANIQSLIFTESSAPTLASKAFANCSGIKNVTVTLSAPFEITNDSFEGTTATLIVPRGSKEAYQAATGWNVFPTIEDTYASIEIGTIFEQDGIKYRVGENFTVTVAPYKADYATVKELQTQNRNYTGDIVIPSTVTYQGTQLKVTNIEKYAFYYSRINSAKIGEGITLSAYCFSDATIKKIELPSDLKVLPPFCFHRTTTLAEITLPEGLTEIGSNCFSTTGNSTNKFAGPIPASVTKFGTNAFGKSLITEYIQPEGVTELPDSLFMDCASLTKVVMNKGTKVGKMLLRGCKQLAEVTLPSDLTSIPDYLFYGCSALQSVNLPAGITKIGTEVFDQCKALTSIDIKDQVTEIGNFTFNNCAALTNVRIAGVKKIASGLFQGCTKLEEVVINPNLESIGSSAFGSRFWPCPALKKITIAGDESGISALPEGVKEIPSQCFRGAKELELKLPSTIESIGDQAFYQCTKFNCGDLPALKYIGHEAFRESGVTSFTFPETIETVGAQLFFGCTIENELIYACANPTTKLVNNASSSGRPLDKAYGYPSPKFKLVVPTGHVDDTKFTSGWSLKEEQEFTAPVLESMNWGESTVNVKGSKVNLENLFSLTFDMKELPEMFAKFNNRETLSQYIFQICYQPVGSTDAIQSCQATYDGEKLSATLKGLEPGEYEYFWQYHLGQNVTERSETSTFIVPERYNGQADMTKILNWVGTGNGSAALIVRWDDNQALDNLVSGIYFDNNATVSAGDIIATSLREDPRFYALQDFNGSFQAYGFDTNGDNSAAVTVNGTAIELVNGIATGDENMTDFSSALGSSSYDHWKVNAAQSDGSANKEWKVFINGVLAGLSDEVTDGDTVVLEYTDKEATALTTADYVFYLRPADRQGIWMQDEIVFDTANGKKQSFPMIANICGDASYIYGSGVGAEIYELDSETPSTALSAYVADGKKGGMSCQLTISSPEEVIVRPFLNIRKDWGNGTEEVKRVYGNIDTKVSSIVANPLTGISLEGINPDDVIEIDNMGTFLLNIVYEPADADFKNYKATFEDPEITSIYVGGKVNYLVAHAAGETTMTLASNDGTVSSTYKVRVKDVDPNDKPDDDFQDGLVWLNEEWFTHTSGSLNYIDANGKIYYRAYGNQNDNMAFGATSQFGTTYAGKYIIMSKQAWDKGDTRPIKSGGRVVVFDAKTFKHIGAIDEIGGDGRACVGVNPSKVYIGTTSGIRVMNLDDITIADADIEGTSTGNSQIGDMIKAGKYVFATNVSKSLLVIDAETDQIVKTIEANGIQTIAQSKDGRIWIGCSKTLTPVNPETLEVGQTYNIPGSVSCSGGSWRHGNLMASAKNNVLLWTNGNFNGNGGNLYRWDIDEVEDPSTLEPIYTHTSKVDGVSRMGYGSCAYDDRTDTYIYSATAGFGVFAMQNWYYFVNATTGELKSCMQLKDYFWFPAMPICPDKYEPEIALGDLVIDLKDGAQKFDLSEFVTDADNLDCNIKIDLAEVTETLADDSQTAEPAATVALEGKTLTITPLHSGFHTFALAAESNGRSIVKEINVEIKDPSGIVSAELSETVTYTVYNAAGIKVATFESADNDYESHLNVPAGVYLVSGSNGTITKVIIR